MKVLAYCRVSTTGQTTDNQRKSIEDSGFKVDAWFQEEGVSGSVPAKQRPEFIRMLEAAESGDTCLVTFIDRLGRDAEDILNTINTFKKMGVRLRVTTLDSIDVTGATGKLVVTILSGLAEMEKAILVERTVQGIARVKSEGVKWGAPAKITPEVFKSILQDKEQGMSLEKVGAKHGYHKNTVQKVLAKWGSNYVGYVAEYESKKVQHASEKSVARKLLKVELAAKRVVRTA